MAFASTSRTIWLSTFAIIICLYFTFNSETFNGSTTIHAEGNSQAPVVETPLTPEEATCKKLGMIKEASCPRPETPFFKALSTQKTPDDQRPLITYAYYESAFARANLKFFVDHALHDAADFIFILNGETDADQSIIFAEPDTPEDLRDIIPKRNKKNIFVKKRPNTCFDLGAHNEVLNSFLGGEGWIGQDGPIPEPKGMLVSAGDKMLLRNKYKRYILMNASIRGPFVPRWSTQCWTDSYLNRLTDKIKLVGMSYNCHNGEGHIQSMIWATDHIGLQHILTKAAIGECFGAMAQAMLAEVRTTQVLRDLGFEVDTFMSVYHSENRQAKYARMRAKKAKGIKQFKRGEIESGAEEAEGAKVVARETEEEKKAKEAKAKKEKEEKEAKEKKEKEAKAAAAAAAAKTTSTHIPTASEVAAAKAAEEEKARKAAEAKAAAEAAAKIQKEKNDKLLLIEDNDMPGYFWRECKHEDWLGPGSYFGTFVHPYENLFMKSHRKIEDTVLDNLTKWHDGWGYESYDVCF